MRLLNSCSFPTALFIAASLIGCSSANKSPDVSGNIGKALDQAGIKHVSTSEDREKGVVTLTGNVASDSEKAQAQSIAEAQSAGLVVSNQLALVPPGDSHAKQMNSDLDKGIGENLDAALIQGGLHHGVKYSVKNHVVTLTGDVDSDDARARAQQVASAVPNVQQVVNELQVKNQKATSSN
jgi:hyperosmotically inducible periplasmic protein